MRKILTILLLGFAFVGRSQTFTPVAGSNITVTIGGVQLKAFTPTGYGTTPASRLYFNVHFCGDFTTISGIEGQRMGNLIQAGGNWNGIAVMPNNDNVLVCDLQIPDVGNQPLLIGLIVKTAIQSWSRLDPALTSHFSLSGWSGGPGRAISWLQNDTTQIRTIFKRGVFISPTFIAAPFTWSDNGFWWVWYSTTDPNGGTPPNAATGLYSNINGTIKNITAVNVPCHCNTVPDSALNYTGLSVQNGSTSTTNRIRFLIDPTDSYGTGNALPTAVAGSDQTITLPTSVVTVNGSGSFDLDGTIAAYAWSKISGPSGPSITSPTAASTTITGLVAGTYVYRLTVTDDLGAFGSDDITITVNAAPPPPTPIVIGQLALRQVDGLEVLYKIPADTALFNRPHKKIYTIYSLNDSTGKDSAYASTRGLIKKILGGWNGTQKLSNGDTAFFIVVHQIDYALGSAKVNMESVIQWMIDSIPGHLFDTANRTRNIMTAIGQGAERQAIYVLNRYNSSGVSQGTQKFADNFSKFTPVDMYDNGQIANINWTTIKPIKTWPIVSGSNNYPWLVSYSNQWYDSARVRNTGFNAKLSVLSTPQYSQATWDFAYASTGSGGENNMFRYWADDAEFGYPGHKITIRRYDPVGANGQDGQASKAVWYAYDSPWNIKEGTGLDDPGDTTDPTILDRPIVWSRNQIVGDHILLDSLYVITAWYGKRQNASTIYPDTMDLFTHGSRINNKEFLGSNWRTRPDFLARAESIGNSTNWEKLWEGADTTRTLFITRRLNNYSVPFTTYTSGNYREFVFFGYAVGNKDTCDEALYEPATDAQVVAWDTVRSPIRLHAGVCLSNIYYFPDYKGFKNLRGYNFQPFLWKSRWPWNTMNYPTNNDSTDFRWFGQKLQHDEIDRDSWLSVTGANQWIVDTLSHTAFSPMDPRYGSFSLAKTDSLFQDKMNYNNYKTYASNITMAAKVFGRNKAATNVRVRITGGTAHQVGDSVYTRMEMGNEDDGGVHDDTYEMPFEQVIRWWATWDGWGGAMNSGDSVDFGVKYADPSMKLGNGAVIGWNIGYLRAAIRFAKIVRHTRSLPIQIAMVHIYHSWKKNNPGNNGQTLIGGHGVNPGGNGYPDDLTNEVVNSVRKEANQPPDSLSIEVNEWGWDKTFMRPQCISDCGVNIFNQSLYGVPLNNAALDSAIWQSILLIRGTAIMAARSIKTSAYFTFTDDRNPYSTGLVGPYEFSGSKYYHGLGQAPDYNIDSITYSAAHYSYRRDFLMRFANWKVSQVIDHTDGGRYVYKFSEINHPDSVMLMEWREDTLNNLVNYVLNTTGIQGLIKEFIPSHTAAAPTTATLTPVGSLLSLNAGLMPRFILYSTNFITTPTRTRDYWLKGLWRQVFR